jgi:branched-chain amino acid transport system permease protein
VIGIASYLVFFLCVVSVLAIVALGLNLQWGYTGLFNAGIVGFYAIGAYAHAILTTPPKPGMIGNFDLPFVVGLAGAMAASAAAAWIVALATIRLRDDYLAIATFGIATTIQLVTLNFEALTGSRAFRGRSTTAWDRPPPSTSSTSPCCWPRSPPSTGRSSGSWARPGAGC